MSMVAAWIAFPVVLVGAAAGCGLLLERAAGRRMPGALVPVGGLAVIIVVGQLATIAEDTAALATPLMLALAAIGAVLGLRERRMRPEPWTLAAAVATFVVFGAPVLASGEPTFAGYIKLDDTATWLAITDRVMEHGRSLDGLPPSTYEATLDFNFSNGYPIGAFLPLGVAAIASGQDPAWTFQPYVATLGAMLALGLSAVVGPVVRPAPARAAVTFISAQPALLIGYALWGGVKEVAAAALLPLVAALAVDVVRDRASDATPRSVAARAMLRELIPLAVAAAAVIAVLSVGGAVWLAPLLLPAAGALARWTGPGAALRRGSAFAGIALALIVPALALDGLVRPWSRPLTSDESLGNLLDPLSPLQVVGVWPSGDFRLRPELPLVGGASIAVTIGAAIAGAVLAVRSRARSLVAYVAGTLAACAAIVTIGSPWVDGKALAIASPCVILVALFGAATATRGRWRPAAAIAFAVIVAGVLWSNALAYREATLAPHDQLRELERIGTRIAGHGPTLMTEYQPYGTRHFLRDAAPEGISELRRRRVALRDGATVKPGRPADTDDVDPEALLAYRTLVLRRSPIGSRPPPSYRLVFSGEFYDVWQRGEHNAPHVVAHRGLGTGTEPLAVPRCEAVRRIARRARPDGTLAAATRPPALVVPLVGARRPRDWAAAGDAPNRVLPRGGGEIRARVRVRAAGRYDVWLGGSVRSRLELLVDGVPRASVRHRLNNAGQYIQLARIELGRGPHRLALRLAPPDLHPGSGGQPFALGPLVLARAEARDAGVERVRPDSAGQLCGRPWDWIAALDGRP